MKPTLLILAAGIGSRYGGLKQLDALCPNGETIMEYSIYDALKAGFGKVILVIRKDFLGEFEKRFSKLRKHAAIVFVFQDVNPKIEGIEKIAPREKPWGTVHAVLSASDFINEPFAVINADDFYGKESFGLMAKFLKNNCTERRWSLIGYPLKNTLSEHGAVSRGICETDEKGFLKKVKERRGIQKHDAQISYKEADAQMLLKEDALVSMNFWGFHPHFFEEAEKHFRKFVSENGGNPKAEMVLPDLVQTLIENRLIEVSVLKTNAKWFGVTHKEDREGAVNELNNLVKHGFYPAGLWRE